MKKKKSTKSRARKTALITLLFLLFCLCGAGYSVKLFYDSMNSSLRKMNERPIATIQFKRKTAQRKFEERMVWDRLKQNSPIYNADTIRTAPESEATIYFQDGNVIEVGESTMIQVFFRDGAAETSIQDGEVVVNSTGAENGMRVNFGGSVVELQAGTSLAATNVMDDGSAKIDVINGTITFIGEDGVERTIEAGDSLALDENHQEKVIPLITVTSPKPNEKVLNFSGEEQTVNFKWYTKNLSYDDFLILEIAEDKKFNKIIQRKELKDTTEIQVALKNGIAHWRIYPAQAGVEYSAVSKVSVLETPRPELIIPESGANFSYKTRTPDVRFNWAQNEWVSAFDFEVADNPQMANPVIKQRITTPSSIVSSLEQGKWYWRVTPFYSINNVGLAAPSDTRDFTVSRINSLADIELVYPADGDLLNTEENDSLSFSWKNNAEVGEYEIFVAKDDQFSQNKIRQKQKMNFLNVKPSELDMQTGTWYWYVAQYDANGDFESKSEVRKFLTDKLEYEQKIIYPPETYSTSDLNAASLRFSWKSTVPGDTVFQIARDASFKDFVVNETNNEQFHQGTPLAGGTYYWRIASKDNPQYTSPARTLNIIAPLETPVLVYPANNAGIAVGKTSGNTFTWNAVSGADYYLVNFYKQENPESAVRSEMISGTTCSIDLGGFDDGGYIWSVQAGTRETEYAAPRFSGIGRSVFEITKPKNIELLFPANGARIDGLSAMERPGVARWDAMEQRISSSTFTLSRNSNGYSNAIMSLDNPPQTVQLPRLEPGTYYWTVRARNRDGDDISAAPMSFTVTNVGLLPKAVLSGDAAHNEVFTAERIRNSRAIDFEWSEVPNATSYSFILRNERGEVLVNRTLGETSFHLNDMADLGNGRYTWSVQASQEASDGTHLRRGEISTGAFTIDLPDVEEIKINDTGILYGM